MLLPSTLSVIIWHQFALFEPFWWFWVVVIALGIIITLTFLRVNLQPIRAFALILFTIFFIGYGGGWHWGLIPLIRGSPIWQPLENEEFMNIGLHLLRLLPALVILVGFQFIGRKRTDYFLIKGTINAPVEPSKLIGMKNTEPWTRIGPIFAAIFVVGCVIFLMIGLASRETSPAFTPPRDFLAILPLILLIAAINAFNEEFTLRAAPLSELWQVLGKQQALLITTFYFGIGHYYGVPNGIIGVTLSAFLGWFLGKSLLETKGFFWAWFIHFLPDVIIFSFYALGAMA